MKRFTSLLLALILTAAFFTVPFYADSTAEQPDKNSTRYLGKLVNYMNSKEPGLFSESNRSNINVYREVYYHYDNAGEIDWALIQAETPYNFYDYWLFDIIGLRVISDPNCRWPFPSRMGIYDAKRDTFIDMGAVDLDAYDDLEEIYNEKGYNGAYGGLLGDIDKDNAVTISDATLLQRCLIGMIDFPQSDNIMYQFYDDTIWSYSDFNRDRMRDILDVTCIQRYLAKQPYPISEYKTYD